MVKLDIFTHYDLQPHNTLAIPAVAGNYVEVINVEQLKQALKLARELNLAILVLGGGSNIVLPDLFAGLVIKVANKGITVKDEDESHVWLEVAAGESWSGLVEYCLNFHYWGLENLSLIPGTVGAAPIQNIGAYGVELQSVFAELMAIERRSGMEVTFVGESCGFGYRDSVFKSALKDQYIIVSVTLKLSKKPQLTLSYPALQQMLVNIPAEAITPATISQLVCDIRRSKLPDPTHIPNAGSFFKNPVLSAAEFLTLQTRYADVPHYPNADGSVKIPAAWLLDKAGWKGVEEYGVGMHSQQALVLVNPGQRSGTVVMAFATKVQADIQQKFAVHLEFEPAAYLTAEATG